MAWDFSQSNVTFDNPRYLFDGSVLPPNSISPYVGIAPQQDPTPNGSKVWGAAFANTQGPVPARFIFAPGQYDPGPQPVVFKAITSLPGAIVNRVSAAPQGVDLNIQPWVKSAVLALQAPIIQKVVVAPQSVDLTIQGSFTPASTGPAAPLITQWFASPQGLDLTVQGTFARPLVAPPIVPGPLGQYVSTLPQFEDRPTRAVWEPLKGFATAPKPLIGVPPQPVDLTIQGYVRGTAPGAHGRVPPLLLAQPPQQDFSLQPQLFRPLAVSNRLPIRTFFAAPQSVDLTLQPWVQPNARSSGGAVPPYLWVQPPQQDFTLLGQWFPSAPGIQGTTYPNWFFAEPQHVDLSIQPLYIPDDAVPPAAYEYAFTLIAITSLDQLPFPAATSTILENSAAVMTATYYSQAGTVFVPNSVHWQLNDVTTGVQIVAPTALIPATSNQVAITAAQNAMISNSRIFEQHEFTVTIVDGAGETYVARKRFLIVRTPAFPGWVDPTCGNC